MITVMILKYKVKTKDIYSKKEIVINCNLTLKSI